MVYTCLILLVILNLGIAIIKWINARKKAKNTSEPTDISFVANFIVDIPTLIVVIYTSIFKPSHANLLLLCVILVSGIFALTYGIWYDRNG